jgi:methionyl aminopeptidase
MVAFLHKKDIQVGEKDVPNFPGTLCVSINDEIIHGIPSNRRVIRDGDVVSIDLVVYKNGFHGDAARTFIVGNSTPQKKKLVDITKQAFFEGIRYAVKGNRIGDISHAIGEFVEKNGFNVVREFQGHGIGEEMHEDPGIPNYGKAGRGIRLEPGMTLAIEPMVMIGKPDICVLDDGWTIVTEDESLAAHYENTILITEKEPEILTLS